MEPIYKPIAVLSGLLSRYRAVSHFVISSGSACTPRLAASMAPAT